MLRFIAHILRGGTHNILKQNTESSIKAGSRYQCVHMLSRKFMIMNINVQKRDDKKLHLPKFLVQGGFQ